MERLRPKLVYRNVIRGEQRLEYATRIGEMRQDGMMWREIGAVLGITASKAYDILNKVNPEKLQDYIDKRSESAPTATV